MVAIHLICVGKLKEKHFAAACAEYEKRLGPFCRLTVTELAEERLPEDPSQAQIDAALEKEAGRIREKPLQPRPGPDPVRLDGGGGLLRDPGHRGVLRPPPRFEGPGAP